MTARDDGEGLLDLGWSPFFHEQIEAGEADLAPVRIASVHRARLGGMAGTGAVDLVLPPDTVTRDYAVGDWVLAEPLTWTLRRRLARKTLLKRTTGDGSAQLFGANIDTLFIVTSCNADFNVARLERYLALANEAGTRPVIVLTKADTAGGADTFAEQAATLQRDLAIIAVDPRQAAAVSALKPWCGPGQTVALTGSSGVGKSTLVNTLAREGFDTPRLTGGIREHDAKGRHTTTARSLHPIAGGGWIMDTPGIRTLHVNEMAEGLGTVFAEITELAAACKFNDCTHSHEPGCAVLAAVASGAVASDRLERWRKLSQENAAGRGNRAEAGPGKPAGRRKGKA